MDEIRRFSEEHVGAVCNLYLSAARGQTRQAPPQLQEYFRDIFFRNPWASEDISSLVFLSDGQLTGFLGVIPRSMLFRGRPIRVACLSLFLVDRNRSTGAAAMKLLRQLYDGPQDLTFGDGASNEASTVFVAAGAKPCYLYSFNWIKVLRPFGAVASSLNRFGQLGGYLTDAGGMISRPLDYLSSVAPGGLFRPPQTEYVCSEVTSDQLFECILESKGREALRPSYNLASFRWLIAHAGEGPGHVGFRMVVTKDCAGSNTGWFVYYAPKGRPATVLHVASLRKQFFPQVLSALFHDAWNQGVTVVKGRAIAQQLTLLTDQGCIFRQPYPCVYAHSMDSDIVAALQAGDSDHSRLDGSFWLRLPLEDWR